MSPPVPLACLHVGPLYNETATVVQDGTDRLVALGFDAAGYFIGGNYATYYPGQVWGSVPTNLTQLVQTPAFQHVINHPSLKRIYFKCFTFANGTDDAVLQFDEPFQLANEYNEQKALATYLLQNTSGKDFYLQNTEADFDYLGGVDFSFQPAAYRNQLVAAFMNQRILACRDARESAGPSTSRVFSVIECNRTLDAGRRLFNEVLPLLTPDAISHSIYQSILLGSSNTAQTIAYIQQNVPLTIKRTRDAFAQTHGRAAADAIPIYFGEWGFPEARSDFALLDYNSVIDTFLGVCADQGVVSANFWQLWDNVIGPADGLPVGVLGKQCIQNSDNSFTMQGTKILSLL